MTRWKDEMKEGAKEDQREGTGQGKEQRDGRSEAKEGAKQGRSDPTSLPFLSNFWTFILGHISRRQCRSLWVGFGNIWVWRIVVY